MTATRFDNLSTDDLAAREAAARAELKELEEAIRARILSEAKVKIGKTYRVGPPSRTIWPWHAKYEGRIIWVRYLKAERDRTHLSAGPWVLIASGPLKRPRKGLSGLDRGHYSSVHPDVLAARLLLDTEAEAPPDPYDRSAMVHQ